jgi:hypothetical protein
MQTLGFVTVVVSRPRGYRVVYILVSRFPRLWSLHGRPKTSPRPRSGIRHRPSQSVSAIERFYIKHLFLVWVDSSNELRGSRLGRGASIAPNSS